MRGEHLGAYRIERELGAGGMGKVYAATVADRVPGLDVGAPVALKLVHPHLLESPGFFKRFMREAEIGRSVAHPNVVRTYDADAIVSGGVSHHFLVMELVAGQTLRALVEELETVPEELCRHVAREICKGLVAIHDAGVVHRDLKPENVLITPQHEVKVMDLGVARLADESIRLSRSGAFVGSVEYGAPEQFAGGEVDHRCDLHALGVLLYEIASGRHPFRGDDYRGVMRRICEEEPRRLGELNQQLSQFFEEAVHTLLAKSRDDRFATAAETQEVFEQGEDSAWWHERARALRDSSRRPLRRVRVPRETIVHGRDAELAQLRGLFDDARRGEGRVVLIEGEAGIGKSRLVDELVARLQQEGEDVAFLFGCYPPGGAAAAAGGLSTAFREHFGEDGSAPYLRQTPLLVPAFDAVLRGEPAPTGAMELTRDSLGTCFVHALRNVAAERPTILLVDDLHFAPEEARALFSALALAIPDHRVLLVGTTRPGLSEEWVANLTRLDHAQHMELARLTPKDLAALLEECLGSKILALELGMQVTLKSDGNPFFVFEILRGLREGQFITRKDDGTWVSTRVIDEIQIPSSVMDLVNARVANLDEDERNLLDVASCLGFEFDPLLVGDVLEIAQIPLMRRLAHIEKKHRLVRSAGRRFAFDHHQVQESLYAAMPELLREPYHAALADALERRTKAADAEPDDVPGQTCVDLCEHFLRGDAADRALRYLDAAVEYLTEGHLHLQAAELLRQALASDALAEGTERAKRLVLRARALVKAERIVSAIDAAREALALSQRLGDPDLEARASLILGSSLHASADYGAAEPHLRTALEHGLATESHEIAARAASTLALTLWATSRLDEADELGRRAADIASRNEGLQRVLAVAANVRGNVAWSHARFADARALYLSAHELAEQHALSSSSALSNVALIDVNEGEYERARETYDRAIQRSRELGERSTEAHQVYLRANLDALQGRLAAWCERSARALTLAREVSARFTEMNLLATDSSVWWALGCPDAASEELDRALAMAREAGVGYLQVQLLTQKAAWLCDSGRTPDGLRLFDEAMSVAAERYEASTMGISLTRAGVYLDAGDDATAAAALEDARAVASRREHLTPDAEVSFAVTAARLPGGDVVAAAAALESLGARLPHHTRMWSHHALWRVTRDRHHLREARRALDYLIEHAPEEHHESMRTNVKLHREILEDCAAEGICGTDELPGPHTERDTRVG